MNGRLTDEMVREEEVRCVTIDQLFEEHNVEKVNILLVDTEGMDGVVLGQFDLEKYLPDFVFFEHVHLPISELEACLARFRNLHYDLIPTSVDTFCYQQTAE